MIVWLEDAHGQPGQLPDPPAVVLLHFTVPYRHAGHVVLRAGDHTSRAWRLAVAASRAGPVVVARVWRCGSATEADGKIRAIESAGARGRYCPVCRAGKVQA